MPSPVDLVSAFVQSLLGFSSSAAGDAVGALVGFLGRVLDGLAALASHVLALLPDAAPLGLSVPAGWIIGYTFIDAIIPLHEALAWFAFFVVLRAAITVWHLGVTAYHLIPKPLIGT